jgi:hypothetical protein
MFSNLANIQDSQHIYLSTLITVLKDDIASLTSLKKSARQSYIYIIEEMILAKIEIVKVLDLNAVIPKEEGESKLDLLNSSNFNLIEYLLDIEINQHQIFKDTLSMLNYTDEKKHMISRLCKKNIDLLKSFKYDF